MAREPKALGASASIGSLVEKCYTLRFERLTAEKKIEEMKEQETSLKQQIIAMLVAQGLEKGGSGRVTGAILRRKRFFILDRKSFGEYVIKTKQYDLYESRPAQTACAERWEAGEQLPGVEVKEITDLSLTKVGEKPL